MLFLCLEGIPSELLYVVSSNEQVALSSFDFVIVVGFTFPRISGPTQRNLVMGPLRHWTSSFDCGRRRNEIVQFWGAHFLDLEYFVLDESLPWFSCENFYGAFDYSGTSMEIHKFGASNLFQQGPTFKSDVDHAVQP